MLAFLLQQEGLSTLHPTSNCVRTESTGFSARLELRRSRRNRKTRSRAPRCDNRVRSTHKGWLAASVENRNNAPRRTLLPFSDSCLQRRSLWKQQPSIRSFSRIRTVRAKRTSRAISSVLGTFENMSSSETGMLGGIVTAHRTIRFSASITWTADAQVVTLPTISFPCAKPVTMRCTVVRPR